MSELDLQISVPPTGVTLEYDSAYPSYSEAAKRGRLEKVTAAIILAADAAMRADDPRSEEFCDPDVLGLYCLSSEFTHGLMHSQADVYSIGGLGSSRGGYNLLGDVAVSRGYNYDSPQGTDMGNTHWHKKTLQMVANAPRQLTVGAYAHSQQHIQMDTLKAVLEAPEFASAIGDTGLRIAGKQPVSIKELSSSVYDDVPSEIVLTGIHDYLSSQNRLSYEAFQVSRPSKYGALARATVKNNAASIGISLELRGSPEGFEEEIQMTTDPTVTTFRATNMTGSLATLSSMTFIVKPIALNRNNGKWEELNQDENVIQRQPHVDAAEELNLIVEDMKSRLTTRVD